LPRGEQVGERRNHLPGNGALQVPRAVSQIGAFAQEEGLCVRHYTEHKRHAASIQHLLLNNCQFDIENFAELFGLQLMKDDDAIEAVHEFGRKSAPSCFDGSAFEFHVQTGSCLRGWFHESHCFAYQSRYFARAEIRGENDNRLREIDATCIAKRQSGFVQHPEQQLPQRIRGLFDLIK